MRRDVLVEVIASKLREGYWVESQWETEASLVALGRKRWFGVFGGRVPAAREIVRVDERGRTRVEVLRARTYCEIAALCISVEGERIAEGR